MSLLVLPGMYSILWIYKQSFGFREYKRSVEYLCIKPWRRTPNDIPLDTKISLLPLRPRIQNLEGNRSFFQTSFDICLRELL